MHDPGSCYIHTGIRGRPFRNLWSATHDLPERASCRGGPTTRSHDLPGRASCRTVGGPTIPPALSTAHRATILIVKHSRPRRNDAITSRRDDGDNYRDGYRVDHTAKTR